MPPTTSSQRNQSFQTTPIFVLGLQRSGTTWLANMLCQIEACAGVQSDDHGGIHESLFFSHFSRSYGDLTSEANFARFVHDFAKCDYFLLSKVPETWLAERQHRTYGTIFQELMERVALGQGATHWVEKSPHHSLLCEDLARLYPRARFVCLTREPGALIPSLVNAPWRRKTRYPLRALTIARSSMTYQLYRSHLERFVARHANAILLRYEDLTAACEQEMRKLCSFLDLPYREDMLHVSYQRNSSFQSSQARSAATSRHDEFCIQRSLGMLRWAPLDLLRLANKVKLSFRPEPWPDWVWRRCPLKWAPPAVSA